MRSFGATTILIYAAAVIVWGSTWIMMKFQLGEVAPAASLTYRYLIAGVLVLAGAVLFGKAIWLTASQHLWCAVQGALMFSVNYWLTYLAAAHLTTGIVSVFFAGVSAVTMLIQLVLFFQVPPLRAAIGAGLGIAGTALVFWPEIEGLPVDGPQVTSGLLVILSVVLFATGGIIGARNLASGMPRYATIGWGMVYGGLWMALLTVVRGETFGFETSFAYIASLVWLVTMGSIFVFVLYFILVERIGAERASYATVMFPLVALIVSTFAEDYNWPLLAVIGVPLALIGNALVLSGTGGSPAPAQRGESEFEPVEWPVNAIEIPEGEVRS
ncbi:MAG: DMT family transporter [Pseudomonadota bacterium]